MGVGDLSSVCNFITSQWSTPFKSPSEQASTAALLPPTRPYPRIRSNSCYPAKRAKLSKIGIHFCFKNAKARKAGKSWAEPGDTASKLPRQAEITFTARSQARVLKNRVPHCCTASQPQSYMHLKGSRLRSASRSGEPQERPIRRLTSLTVFLKLLFATLAAPSPISRCFPWKETWFARGTGWDGRGTACGERASERNSEKQEK